MAENTVSEGWLIQRKLLELVRGAPGGGLHRTELEAELELDWPQIWQAAARTLYGRRLVDFCGAYLVDAPRPRGGAQPRRPDDDSEHPERKPSNQLRLVPCLADSMREASHA